MKLSEALRKRKIIADQISKLEERAKKAASVRTLMEGDTAIEIETYTDVEFQLMLNDLEAKRKYLLAFKKAIIEGNCERLDDFGGKNINDLIAERNNIKAEMAFWSTLITNDTYDIRKHRILAKDVDAKVDAMTTKISELDNQINAINTEIEVSI
ncbi:MAG: hypothetical protein AABY32_04115 [Nanoarchaeota archaeon]